MLPSETSTIKECIDLSVEPDESLLIKLMPNVPLHQALTDDELDLHAYFGEEDDSDAVSEYWLLSEEEDLFTPAAAKDLLYTLAEQNKQQARLQDQAAKLLVKGGLPQEIAEQCSNKPWDSKGGPLPYLKNCMTSMLMILSSI